MLLYEEKVSATEGEFSIDASEINSLTDWQDQDLQLPKTRNGIDVFRFSTRGRRIVMTVAPECVAIFDDTRNRDLALLLGFAPGTYPGGRIQHREYVASKPFKARGTLSFIYTYCDLVVPLCRRLYGSLFKNTARHTGK